MKAASAETVSDQQVFYVTFSTYACCCIVSGLGLGESSWWPGMPTKSKSTPIDSSY